MKEIMIKNNAVIIQENGKEVIYGHSLTSKEDACEILEYLISNSLFEEDIFEMLIKKMNNEADEIICNYLNLYIDVLIARINDYDFKDTGNNPFKFHQIFTLIYKMGMTLDEFFEYKIDVDKLIHIHDVFKSKGIIRTLINSDYFNKGIENKIVKALNGKKEDEDMLIYTALWNMYINKEKNVRNLTDLYLIGMILIRRRLLGGN